MRAAVTPTASRPACPGVPSPSSSDSASSWSPLRVAVLYLLSVACLAAYSAVLARLSFGYVAAVFSVALLLLDVVLALLVYSRLSHRPGVAACLLLATRLLVCCGGERWYLAGHTALFVALSLYIWPLVLDNTAPARRTRLVPPFSSHALQLAGTTGFAANSRDEAKSEPVAKLHAAERDAGGTTASPPPAACAAPLLPAAWPAPTPLANSFTRLPLLSVALWLVWLLFAADVFVAYELLSVHSSMLATPESTGEWAYESAAALLLASPLCVALVGALSTVELMALSLLWRLYRNAHYQLTAGCWLLLAVCDGPLLAAAIALQLPEQAAPLWLSLCLAFVPALLLHSTHLFCQWRLRDYRVAVESAYTRFVQSHPAMSAQRRHAAVLAVRRFDGSMLLHCTLQAALVAGLSGCLAALCSPWYAGVTVLLCLTTLHCTVVPLCQWFQSFAWTRAMSAQCVGAAASLLSLCLLHFLAVQRGQLGPMSFLLLLLALLYPAVLSVLLALYKWRDDAYSMSSFTVWCLLAGVLSLVLFCFLVALLFPPWYVGAGLLLVVVSLLALLLHALPGLHSHRSNPSVAYAPTAGALAFYAFGALLSAALPVALGVYFSDVWLAFTAACAVLLAWCAWQLLGCAHSLHSSASPVSALTADWLSSLCRPHCQYALVDTGSVLGVWLLPALSSASHCTIAPPRSLRHAALSAYCLLATLFVWSTLSLFFPPAASSASSASDHPPYTAASFDEPQQSAASIAVSVAAALLVSSYCAAYWLTLHIAHVGRRQAVQFAVEMRAVTSASEAQSVVSAVAWADSAEADECAAEAECSEAALARAWLTAANARARRAVPKVESFSSAPTQSAIERPFAALHPKPAASSNKVALSSLLGDATSGWRSWSSSTSAGAGDELLSFVQSFHSLLHSASPPLTARAEYDSACSLHDRYMAWTSERRLFALCRSVQLHHLLLLAQHDDVSDAAAMGQHFEALQDEADDRRGSPRRRDRLCAYQLALLSTHHAAAQQLPPSSADASTVWSQYSGWLTGWRTHRAFLLRAARRRREEWDEASQRRQRAVAAAAERQLAVTTEAIAQRLAERRKALQLCQQGREQERADGEQEALFDRQQTGKRRSNDRSARKRSMRQSTQQPAQTQRQRRHDTPTEKRRPSQADTDTAASSTKSQAAQQRGSEQASDELDALTAGAERYWVASSTARRAAQSGQSSGRSNSKAARRPIQHVSHTHTRHSRLHCKPRQHLTNSQTAADNATKAAHCAFAPAA